MKNFVNNYMAWFVFILFLIAVYNMYTAYKAKKELTAPAV